MNTGAGQPSTIVDPSQGASELTKAVKATRWASIAIIVSQLVALGWGGFYFYYSQVPLTILTIIMGCVVLCHRVNECVLKTAIVVYSLFAVASILRVVDWYVFINFVNNSSNDDDSSPDDVPADLVLMVAWPNILGAILFVVGAVYASKAFQQWKQNGSLPPV